MAPSNKVEHSSLGHRVLEYFRQNARAMDSADGVARFWVGEQVGLVERCLVDLYRRGLLERRTIAGTDYYSLQEVSHLATPLESRILAVCKEFVRRTAGSERDPEAIRHALEAIRNQESDQHDPRTVAALCQLLEEGEVR